MLMSKTPLSLPDFLKVSVTVMFSKSKLPDDSDTICQVPTKSGGADDLVVAAGRYNEKNRVIRGDVAWETLPSRGPIGLFNWRLNTSCL